MADEAEKQERSTPGCSNCFYGRRGFRRVSVWAGQDSKSQQFIDCCRWPAPVEKLPEDWCGEFKSRAEV
jgi:hypothetical protein